MLNGRGFCALALLLTIGLIAAGCFGSGGDVVKKGSLLVSVEIPQELRMQNVSSQSILTEVTLEKLEFVVTKGSLVRSKTVDVTASAEDVSVVFTDMEMGYWQVWVAAVDDQQYEIAIGISDATVSSSDSTETEVVLRLLPGELVLEVVVPADDRIDAGKVTLLGLVADVVDIEKEFSAQPNEVVTLQIGAVPARMWLLVAELFTTDQDLVVSGEAQVLVLPGRVTTGQVHFFGHTPGSLEIVVRWDLPPVAPVDVTAHQEYDRVIISWEEVDEAEGYMVVRSATETGSGELVQKLLIFGTTVEDPGPFSQGQMYYYRVLAYDEQGLSSRFSEAASVTIGPLPEYSYLLVDETVVLDPETEDALVSVSSDYGWMMFGHMTPQLEALAVGDILVGGVTEATPDGFARRVEDIYVHDFDPYFDNPVELTTGPVAAEEVFQHCALRLHQTLTPSDFEETVSLLAGVETVVAQEAGEDNHTFGFTFSDVILHESPDASISANGTIRFSLDLILELLISFGSLEEFNYILRIDSLQDVEVFTQGDAEFIGDFSELVPFQTLKGRTIVLGVFVFRPMVTLFVGLDGEVYAKFSAHSIQVQTTDLIASWEDDGWSFDTEFDNLTLRPIGNDFISDLSEEEWISLAVAVFTQDIIVSFTPFAGASIQLNLWGQELCRTEFIGFVEFEALPLENAPWWTLEAGIDIIAQLSLPVLRSFVDPIEVTMLEYRRLLARSEGIDFKCDNLERAVKTVLAIPGDRDVYAEDVRGLIALDVSSQGITSLQGLEYFLDLEDLDISKNSIESIYHLRTMEHLKVLDASNNYIERLWVLSSLPSISVLNLANNAISNVFSLGSLTEITYLDLSHNNLTSIGDLTGLVQLEILRLSYNEIFAIDTLEWLHNLEGVCLKWNNIQDIDPIVENSRAGGFTQGWLDIRYNFLAPIEGSDDLQKIEELIRTGIEVIWDPQK